MRGVYGMVLKSTDLIVLSGLRDVTRADQYAREMTALNSAVLGTIKPGLEWPET